MKKLRLAASALMMFACAAVSAQDYPAKPVRIVIPYAVGGGVDAATRLVAQHLSTVLGQNFIVDARPGGATVIATLAVARAPADGYTLLLTGGNSLTLLPLTYPGTLPFDVKTDLKPIGMVSRMPFFLTTSAQQPYQNLKDLLADVKSKPGQLAYASNGAGLMSHMGTELVLQSAGASMIHVPYAGFTPALVDVVTKRVTMVLGDLGVLGSQIQGGTLKPLAVASKERSRFMPNVPTLAESGVRNAEFEVWLALYAPANTPQPIVDKLSKALSAYLASPEAREAFARLGHEPDPSGPAVVAARPLQEQQQFLPVLQSIGMAKKAS